MNSSSKEDRQDETQKEENRMSVEPGHEKSLVPRIAVAYWRLIQPIYADAGYPTAPSKFNATATCDMSVPAGTVNWMVLL